MNSNVGVFVVGGCLCLVMRRWIIPMMCAWLSGVR